MDKRSKDLTGQIFGRLTVIRRVGKHPTSNTYSWECRCNCGNTVIRNISSLQKSRKLNQEASCGCKYRVFPTEKVGMLTPLREAGKRENGFDWLWLCECGNETVKNVSAVMRKEGALHCGCIPNRGGNSTNSKFDHTGETFGFLTVIGHGPIERDGHSRWLCECVCGKRGVYRGYYLRRGTRTSCGCKTVLGEQNHSFKGVGELYKSHWTSIVRNAEMRKISVELTMEQAWQIFLKQGRICALTGDILFLGRSGSRTASLDRIDSSKGYSADNVHWVHKDVNLWKMDKTMDAFHLMCEKVVNYRKLKDDNYRRSSEQKADTPT